MATTHLLTPCGRYGKRHGEPFLIRCSTQEPMETPRRYYESDEKFHEGNKASLAAWHVWKEEHFGDTEVGRMPWFELVDQELRQVTDLVHSDNHGEFQYGVEILQNRITASEEADGRLNADKHTKVMSKDERDELREVMRRGPPFLAGILRDLQGTSRKQEAREKLASLCDDAAASTSMRLPTQQSHRIHEPSHSRSRVSQSTRRSHRLEPSRCASSNPQPARSQSHHPLPSHRKPSRVPIPSYCQGEEVGVAHDLVEESVADFRRGNSIYAPYSTPTVQPRSTSRLPSARQLTSRLNVQPQVPVIRVHSPSEPASHSQASEATHHYTPSADRSSSVAHGTASSVSRGSAALQVGLRPPPARAHHPISRSRIAAPAAASPQTRLYMQGGGTQPPAYIAPAEFFPEHGEENGQERPPAYNTTAPSTPVAGQWMPRAAMGEDSWEMMMEGCVRI